jgi:flagellar biosynthetic protein FliR
MPFALDSVERSEVFLWVFFRVGILFLMLPLFGARGIPILWKVGLSLLLAAIVTPVLPAFPRPPQNTARLVMGLASEAFLGLVLSLGVLMLFSSVQLAGQLLGFQMGFNMASALDPQTGAQSSIISQFLYLFTVLLLFAVDGHHLFIAAIVASFEKIPPGSFLLHGPHVGYLVGVGGEMFLTGLKIAAPVMVALFLSNFCLGIVARTVPQVNILMVGFPLNIGLGLVLFGVTLRHLSPFMTGLIHRMGEVMMRLIHIQ